MFTFTNSSLPESVPNPFNFFIPTAKFSKGESSTPLFTIKAFHKYSNTSIQSTEITIPDATYNLYKVQFPFLSIVELSIDGFTWVPDIERLTGQRFFVDGNIAYIVSSTAPDSFNIKAEIIAPLPRSVCELVITLPVGLSVDQVVLKGLPMNFGQLGQELIADCLSSCCRVSGGETLEISGLHQISPILIAQVHVFNITQDIGLIDYVEWRGRRYIYTERDLNIGQFLWDDIAKLLKLIT